MSVLGQCICMAVLASLSSNRYLPHVVSNAWSNKTFENGVKWTFQSTDALNLNILYTFRDYASHYSGSWATSCQICLVITADGLTRGHGTQKSMLEAVVAIRNREMKYLKAAKQSGAPKATLIRYFDNWLHSVRAFEQCRCSDLDGLTIFWLSGSKWTNNGPLAPRVKKKNQKRDSFYPLPNSVTLYQT